MDSTDLHLFGIAVILFGGFFTVFRALDHAAMVWIPLLGLAISLVGLLEGTFESDGA